MHHAIDHIDLDKIFPSNNTAVMAMSDPAAIKKCRKELKKKELNPLQNEVITSIITPGLSWVCINTLVK